MAISWINYNNGETGLNIRNAINAFNTAVTTNVNNLLVSVNSLGVTVASHTTSIAALLAPAFIKFVPQIAILAYQEGQVYYDSTKGSLKVQGPIPGIEIAVGHDMHIHVINNTGAIIEKGMACRQNGVSAGKIQVTKAIATSFNEARVFGVAQADIAVGAEGALITFGEIDELNTVGQPTGVPLYLSDTVAGTYGPVAPSIVTRVGGALVADATIGRFFVSVINNTSLPTVVGGLKGQTPGTDLYAVTTTAQDINDYVLTESIVTSVDPLTGIITIPNTGGYRTSLTASITFPSTNNTREIIFELFDVTANSIVFSYVKNIPRNATEDGLSFSYPFSETVGNQYKMRIKGSHNIAVTITDISFDIESVNIR